MRNFTTLRKLTKLGNTAPKSLPELKKFEIDPVTRTIVERDEKNLEPLIDEVIGNDAVAYPLDSDTTLWCSDAPTNDRYAYYFARMCEPFDMRRYNKGLIASRGPAYWSVDTVKEWLRWHDKKNPYGDL